MLEDRRLNIVLLVLGIVLIFVPYLGMEILQQLSGLLLILIFLFIFFKEFKNDEYEIVDKRVSIAWLIIAALCLIVGVSLMSSFLVFDYISSFWLELVGLLLMANAGLLFYLNVMDHQEATFKVVTGCLGVFYFLMGLGIINEMYIGIVLGIFLAGYAYLMLSN